MAALAAGAELKINYIDFLTVSNFFRALCADVRAAGDTGAEIKSSESRRRMDGKWGD